MFIGYFTERPDQDAQSGFFGATGAVFSACNFVSLRSLETGGVGLVARRIVSEANTAAPDRTNRTVS